MKRTVKTTQEVSYEWTRAEILEAMRAVLQTIYPGAALADEDKRAIRQRCDFMTSGGVISYVDILRITTTYEQPESDDAVGQRDA